MIQITKQFFYITQSKVLSEYKMLIWWKPDCPYAKKYLSAKLDCVTLGGNNYNQAFAITGNESLTLLEFGQLKELFKFNHIGGFSKNQILVWNLLDP